MPNLNQLNKLQLIHRMEHHAFFQSRQVKEFSHTGKKAQETLDVKG